VESMLATQCNCVATSREPKCGVNLLLSTTATAHKYGAPAAGLIGSVDHWGFPIWGEKRVLDLTSSFRN
jgi:hypothetical protein